MPKKTKSDILKRQLVEALEKSLGVVTTAVKIVGIARSTFYEWYNNDEAFKKEVDSIGDIALDFAESQLHKQIKDGNSTATIFYLKTKGKRRGYIERQEITGAEGEPSAFKIEIIDKTEDSNK
jgi:predicted DNA-binding transcriptional regulator AlpA